MEYLVTWEIELDADSPLDAAKLALEIHRDPTSIATVFTVKDEHGNSHQIDLGREDENKCHNTWTLDMARDAFEESQNSETAATYRKIAAQYFDDEIIFENTWEHIVNVTKPYLKN